MEESIPLEKIRSASIALESIKASPQIPPSFSNDFPSFHDPTPGIMETPPPTTQPPSLYKPDAARDSDPSLCSSSDVSPSPPSGNSLRNNRLSCTARTSLPHPWIHNTHTPFASHECVAFKFNFIPHSTRWIRRWPRSRQSSMNLLHAPLLRYFYASSNTALIWKNPIAFPIPFIRTW